MEPLHTEAILSSSDEQFIDDVFLRNSFSFKGLARRFKYRTTNEPVGEVIKSLRFNSNDVILAVSGSSIQLVEMLVDPECRPKLILGFDYSPKQVAYNYLIKAAIQLLSFDEFHTHFCAGGRSARYSSLHRELIQRVPQQFRGYLKRKQPFNKRDLVLNIHNQTTWLQSASSYDEAKKSTNILKFFQYEVSCKNLQLRNLFRHSSIDRVFLSNVLDWVLWHDMGISDAESIEQIIDDFESVISPSGLLILSSLLSKKRNAIEFLSETRPIERKLCNVYRYKWIIASIFSKVNVEGTENHISITLG